MRWKLYRNWKESKVKLLLRNWVEPACLDIRYLSRRGSTCRKNATQMIDIYETYIIDSDYAISKVKLFFNGYFNMYDNTVKVASGFRIKSQSALLERTNFIEE